LKLYQDSSRECGNKGFKSCGNKRIAERTRRITCQREREKNEVVDEGNIIVPLEVLKFGWLSTNTDLPKKI